MLKFPCSVITAAKTAHRDYDFGPGFRLEERIDELLRHAERRQAKELRDLDKAETEEQIGSLMSGGGA